MKTVNFSSIPVNLICLYALGYIFFLIPGFTGTHQRGFYCDDESIKKVFKENTISIPQLLGASILTCFVTILLCEYFVSNTEKRSTTETYRNIPTFLVKALTFIGHSHIGFVTQLALIQIPKYTVGRLRPHFVDICQPTGYNCSLPHQFVTNYTCTGTHEYNLRESRLSFFSGHAATVLFTIVFLSIYLESRLSTRDISSIVVRPIQVALLAISLWVCHTRITDNFHHPTDVLAGMLFGAVVGFYTASHIAGLLTYKDRYVFVENPVGIRFLMLFTNELDAKDQ